MTVALLLLAWILVGLIRPVLNPPWNHIAILLIFFSIALVFMRQYQRFSVRPRGRLGPLLCFGYLAVLLGLHGVLGKWDALLAALPGFFQPEFFKTNVLILGVLVPFYEEFFFRGALFERMKGSFQNPGLMIYVNALIFWLFHAPFEFSVWSQALQQFSLPIGPGPFLLGLVCASIAYFDKSIFWAMVFHGLANCMGTLWANIITNESIFNLFYSRP